MESTQGPGGDSYTDEDQMRAKQGGVVMGNEEGTEETQKKMEPSAQIQDKHRNIK